MAIDLTQYPYRADRHGKRAGDRHKTPQVGDRHKTRKERHTRFDPLLRPIIGIDTEGITLDNVDEYGTHPHHCIYIAAVINYRGERVATFRYSNEGKELSYEACAEFLFQLQEYCTNAGYPSPISIWYSFNYDVQVLLRKLSDVKALQAIWKGGYVRFEHPYGGGHKIKYTPRREFWLSAYDGGVVTVGGHESDRIVRRHYSTDVFGFFQMSFVKALKDWKVGTPEQIERIEAMKDARGTFDPSQLAEISAYCDEECWLLTCLYRKFLDSCVDVGFVPQKHYGAGALAMQALQQFGVKEHIPNTPSPIEIMNGYAGGWFQNRVFGSVDHGWSYDINSAYPAEVARLPSMRNATWKRIHKYRGLDTPAIYHVEYSFRTGQAWNLLYCRLGNGRVLRPYTGRVWVWEKELDAVVQGIHSGAFEGTIKVLGGWELHTNGERPFSFVPELYEKRRVLKAAGDAAEKPVKLFLNSIYGKTAQSIGGKDKRPVYQSFVWAGRITAACRAQVINAIALDPDAVVSVATDGILSSRPLPLPLNPGMLGEWDGKPISNLFLFQSGVYCYDDNKGVTEFRTRGESPKLVPWDRLRESVHQMQQGIPVPITYTVPWRFCPMGAALMRTNTMAYLGRWLTGDMVNRTMVPFDPYIYDVKERDVDSYGITLGSNWYEHFNTSQVTESAAYKPKMTWDEIHLERDEDQEWLECEFI